VLDPSHLAPESPRPITRAEFDRLVALGFFEDESIELLYGVLVRMTPQDPPHSSVVQRLTTLLVPPLVGRADVRIQLPFAASDDSEPEPDVAIVPAGDYRAQHPREAWLVIEVAFSSHRKDRSVKSRLYAECGVSEYWIVDIAARSVEIYTDPRGGVYATAVVRRTGEGLSPARFPELTIRVDDLF
jgi:Uma2 family endonuclease